MNKYDHIVKALRHEDDTIVPFCIHLTGEGYDKYGDRLLEDYPDKDVMDDLRAGIISRNEAVNIAIGNYMIPAPFPWWDWDYAHMPEAYHDPDEIPDVMPPVTVHDNHDADFKKTAYLREKYGAYMIALIWGSHWEKAYFTRGIENMLADFAGAPEFTEQLLHYIVDRNMEMLDILLTCPEYDGVLLGSDWGTQNDLIMSPACWNRMIKGGEERQYKVIHESGKHVFIHSCGCILKVMKELCDMGVDALNPVQPECMDLSFLKKNYGGKLTWWGGISTQRVLPYGTPAEVRAEAERVIRLMSEHGGYITAPSQEIQTDVPYENLRALIDTARYYAGM